MTLLEKYSKRIAAGEHRYMESHQGKAMPKFKKVILAKMLENTNKVLNESFENSVGTQRSDLGAFKKFALTLVNAAVPDLIGPDLVITYPMESFSGYINYIAFVAGSNKGNTHVGDLFNSPFALRNADSTYTSSAVQENGTVSAEKTVALKWGPVIPGTVTGVITIAEGSTVEFYDDGNGVIYSGRPGARRVVTEAPAQDTTVDGVVVGPEDGQEGRASRVEVTLGDGAAIGTITYGFAADKAAKVNAGMERIYDEATPIITFTETTYNTKGITTNYTYNNTVIPQNDLPTLTAKMVGITLQAKARRIAVYFSQMAAFQAKVDYGMNDFGDVLAQQAIGRLAFEIDTEIVELLKNGAGEALASLTWSLTQPVGVSLMDHYASFAKVVEIANATLYRRTLRYRATYMLIAPELLQVLNFVPTWKPVEVLSVNGPYFAGTLGALKVYVTPSFADGEFVLGVNGNAMETSAAVYAPYMPIVPTQLLGYADGSLSQGYSTLYALKLINPGLLVKGKVTA